MKQLIIFSVFVFIVRVANAQPTAPVNQAWVPIAELSDEFNGTSLDDNKWVNYHHYWKGREPSQFNTANVSVSGGNLLLKSTVANYSKTGNWVWSACVSSKTKAMKPGYYSEARIKCSSLSMTGAFWFQGNYSEIDVIENFGQPTGSGYYNQRYNMKTNIHYFPNGWATDQSSPRDKTGLSPAVDEAYFTYGVWWKDPTTIIFYLNGVEAHRSTPGGAFNEDMYMFFDTEVFSWGIGLPTIESLDDNSKNTQYIDYVRTYRLVNSSANMNLISNPDFESGMLSPWTSWGNVSISSDVFNTGSKSVYINGTGVFEQIVFLKPNTKYSYSGWGKVSLPNQKIYLGVKNFGGQESTVEITSTNFENKTVSFTTGPTNISAKLYFYVPGNFQAYGDDFELKEISTTGLTKAVSEKLILHVPNPISDAFSEIKLENSSKPIDIGIFDLNGRLLYQQKNCSNSIVINRNIFRSTGIYLLSAKTKSYYETRKIAVL
ncbi:MAG: carbohydrate binding domain-containing protein [Bacteroidales bacterium]